MRWNGLVSKYPTRIVATVLLVLLGTPPAQAQTSASAWQTDLTYLANVLTRYHADAFHSISKREFDKRVREIAAAIPRMDQSAIVVAIKQLVASIGDAHTGFGFSSAPPMNFFVFPIKVYRYPDGVYVQAAAPAYRNLVGGRIVSIGGVPMDRAEARLNSVADASNVWTKRWWLPFTFRGAVFKTLGLSSTAKSARFEIERNGHSETVDLPVLATPFSLGYALGAPAHSDWVDERKTHERLV